MNRLVLLELGADLSDATADALIAGRVVSLLVVGPAGPFREAQIVRVRTLDGARAGPRDIRLCRRGGEYYLRLPEAPARPGEETLGRVAAVGRGSTVCSLEHGLLRWLPPRWLGRAIDVLEVLARLRHPLTPWPFQGSPEACVAGVRAKYGREAEVREYARHARAGATSEELEIVRRHVRGGGRLLDVGCGAGREALGFARAGFRVVGIDIAPGMVAAARQLAADANVVIDFRVQSVTELAEPPAAFDGAFFAGSLHHIPERARRVDALARIRRALTPEGVLILMVVYRGPRAFASRSRLVDLVRRAGARLPGGLRVSEPGDTCMRMVSKTSDPRDAIFFHDFARSRDVRSEIEAAGFDAEEVRPNWWVCRPRLASAAPVC